MKGKRKNDINVKGRGDMKREGREKGWRNDSGGPRIDSRVSKEWRTEV